MLIANTTTLLLAAGDVWEVIIGVIFFILWVVGQLMGGREAAKKKNQPRVPRPQQPQPVDMADGQLPQNQEVALRSEVEDFLRRAQGKPARAERAEPKSSRPQTEKPSEPRTLVSKADRSTGRSPSHRSPSNAPGANLPVAPTNLREEGVAEHVAKHLNTSAISAHSEALGEIVGHADERLEARLHEKFDHDLGSLQHEESPADAVADTPSVADEIADLLSKPDGMRQMIVANAILRRPEW